VKNRSKINGLTEPQRAAFYLAFLIGFADNAELDGGLSMSGNIWLEIGRIISGLATPIVVAILGVMLLRRIESVKAGITRQSAFHVRWANEFFEACQNFLQCLKRETAILLYLHA
jgi:hypothetical protein